jgi:hypothetical protein
MVFCHDGNTALKVARSSRSVSSDKEPRTAQIAAAQEYGFIQRQPDLPTITLSQATERRIGEDGLFATACKT